MNRKARDLLSDAIVAVMRGEISTATFSERVYSVDWDCEPGLGDLVSDQVIVPHCLTVGEHGLRTDRRGWESLLRVLAFLLSDLRLIERPVARRSGVLRLVILAVALGLARYAGHLPFVGLWMVFCFEWTWSQRPSRSSPFRTWKDWRKHEPLLEKFHLPQWSGEIETSSGIGWRARVRELAVVMATIPIRALLFPLILLSSDSQGLHRTEWVAESCPAPAESEAH